MYYLLFSLFVTYLQLCKLPNFLDYNAESIWLGGNWTDHIVPLDSVKIWLVIHSVQSTIFIIILSLILDKLRSTKSLRDQMIIVKDWIGAFEVNHLFFAYFLSINLFSLVGLSKLIAVLVNLSLLVLFNYICYAKIKPFSYFKSYYVDIIVPSPKIWFNIYFIILCIPVYIDIFVFLSYLINVTLHNMIM